MLLYVIDFIGVGSFLKLLEYTFAKQITPIDHAGKGEVNNN